MTIEQTFEEAVTEFIGKTKEFIDTESLEGIPPNTPLSLRARRASLRITHPA